MNDDSAEAMTWENLVAFAQDLPDRPRDLTADETTAARVIATAIEVTARAYRIRQPLLGATIGATPTDLAQVAARALGDLGFIRDNADTRRNVLRDRWIHAAAARLIAERLPEDTPVVLGLTALDRNDTLIAYTVARGEEGVVERRITTDLDAIVDTTRASSVACITPDTPGDLDA